MENKFNEQINAIKEDLKNLIKDDSSADFIQSIGALDTKIDEAIKEHDIVVQEAQKTKDKLVEVVKASSFKPVGGEPLKDDISGEDNQSLDDIIKSSITNASKEK